MSAGPTETEIKLRVESADAARNMLERAGFQVAAGRVFEANHIYDTPAGNIRSRGELLRLRRYGDRNLLTFKGVAVPGRHKSRPETEVHVEDFDRFDFILRQLGYSVLFRYEKYRTEFRRPGQTDTATVDETPIGVFIELEGRADWIDATARELGFHERDYITASYGTLFQAHRNETAKGDTNMTF